MSWCKCTIQLIPLSVSFRYHLCTSLISSYILYLSYLSNINFTNLKIFSEICCFKWHVVSFFPNRKIALVKFISTQSILLHWSFLWWRHVSICSEQDKESFCLSKVNCMQVSCTSSYYHFLICILNTFAMLVSSQDIGWANRLAHLT